MNSGGTLIGNGTIGGAVTNQSGGTFAPGADANSIGTLTINNSLTLQPGSTTFIKVTKNGDGTADDTIIGVTALNFGGTLQVTNLSGTALAAGDAFPIFSSTIYHGAFAAIVPATPGLGLVWNTNTLETDGTLRVASVVNTNPTNLLFNFSGGTLTLFWPADHTGWRLQMQTNSLLTGLGTNWIVVLGSNLTNSMILPVDATKATMSYRMIYP